MKNSPPPPKKKKIERKKEGCCKDQPHLFPEFCEVILNCLV